MGTELIRNAEREITLTLTERELFLLKWSLDLMARNHTEGGKLRSNIDSLRYKLALKQNL